MRRRLNDLRDRLNASFDRALNESQEEDNPTGLVERFQMFQRQDGGGPARRRRGGRRHISIKVSVLKQDVDVFRSHFDILSTSTVVVPLNLSHNQFLQALRDRVPNIPEEFDLCRLIGQQRRFSPLEDLCPSEIRQGNRLGRSNLYIRPKGAATPSTEVRPPPQPQPLSHPHSQQLTGTASGPQDEETLSPAGQSQPASPMIVVSDSPQHSSPPASPSPSDPDRLSPPASPSPSDPDRLSPPAGPSQPASPPTSLVVDVAVVLAELQTSIKPHNRYCKINAVRGEEYACAERAFSRSNFDPESKIDVIFVDIDGMGEGAVDEGGPTREFCTLLMRQLQNSSIFEGPEEGRTLALDSVALQRGQYRLVGQMVAVCLIQGLVSPQFWSERLYRQVCHLSALPASLEEVTDDTLRAKLQKISDATTVEGAREAVEEATEELSLMGALTFIQSLEKRDDVLRAALHFYFEGRILAAIHQLREGLSIFGLLEAMKRHPLAMKQLFMASEETLNASDLEDAFRPSSQSPHGSNRRRMELRTVGFWRDWLLEVEGGETTLNLGDILSFATGLAKVPAMGFPRQPQLEFLHPEDGPARFPTANTCALILRLPVCQQYPKFKEGMETGITCGSQFGVA